MEMPEAALPPVSGSFQTQVAVASCGVAAKEDFSSLVIRPPTTTGDELQCLSASCRAGSCPLNPIPVEYESEPLSG